MQYEYKIKNIFTNNLINGYNSFTTRPFFKNESLELFKKEDGRIQYIDGTNFIFDNSINEKFLIPNNSKLGFDIENKIKELNLTDKINSYIEEKYSILKNCLDNSYNIENKASACWKQFTFDNINNEFNYSFVKTSIEIGLKYKGFL